MRDYTTLEKLQRKATKLERKYERTNEKAVLKRARILRSYERVQEQIKLFRAMVGQGFVNPQKGEDHGDTS
jgi:hypothetical protein